MRGRFTARSTGRTVCAVLLGAAVAVAQYEVVAAGMRRSAAAPGFEGIGVAWGYGAAVIVLSLVLLTLVSRVLGLQRWALAGLQLFVLEMAVVAIIWGRPRFLHGDARMTIFILVLGLELGAAAVWWPERVRS